MGKGFNNYMCKKFFHPASRDNLKRVWMAEQKADSYKKKQEELRQQYEKEQDLYTNKAILSKESKDKLSVNFMYEPPPGTKKEREREDDEPEYKFEWQRKFNAPREDYCKGDSEIRDQPFGIQVRNVRCIKCHKWGHINTDKECPMYCQSISSEFASSSYDPIQLVQQMRDDGLAMKRSALTNQIHSHFLSNQKLIESSDDDNTNDNQSELEFLKSLSKEQKQKLLRKLEKLEKKNKKLKSGKKKKSVKIESQSDGESSDNRHKASEKKIKKEVMEVKHIKKEPDSRRERHDRSESKPKKNYRLQDSDSDNSHSRKYKKEGRDKKRSIHNSDYHDKRRRH